MQVPYEYELQNVRIRRGRFLSFDVPEDACGLQSPLPIPFGTVSTTAGHRFIARTDGNRVIRLIALPEGQLDRPIKIFPIYSKNITISTIDFGNVAVHIRQLTHDIERLHAMAIILRSHYLSPPARGLVLGCWLVDPAVQRAICEQRRTVGQRSIDDSDKPDSLHFGGIDNYQKGMKQPLSDAWRLPIEDEPRLPHTYERESDAWRCPPERMVGCAVLDTLWHGNPDGRLKLLRDLEEKEDSTAKFLLERWKHLDRRTIVHSLQLAWASRFAVDAPYHKLGLARLLAHHLVEVARTQRVPRPNFVEVITTQPAISKPKENVTTEPDVSEMKDELNDDFLLAAQYVLDPDLHDSDPQFVVEGASNVPGSVIERPMKKLYYYAQVMIPAEIAMPQEADRLFVPLASQPFAWFESGKKLWELRKYGAQYTEKHVYDGRRVELRRGYSDRTRNHWGTIREVVLTIGLAEMFTKVPYNQVIPTAKSEKEAIEQAAHILRIEIDQPRPLIAFRVEIDQQ
jgi:GNAT superfamily N-acetyltransferase